MKLLKSGAAVILCLVFLSSTITLNAQDGWTKSKVKDPEELNLDQKINSGFQPVTDAVSRVVFFDFKIKNDIDFFKLGTMTKEADGETVTVSTSLFERVEVRPYELVPDYNSAVQFGKQYVITDNGANYTLSYDFTEEDGSSWKAEGTFEYGATVTDDGYNFVINKKDPASTVASAYALQTTAIRMPFVLLVLLLGALYFTLFFRFVNIRKFGLAIQVVRGKYFSANPSTADQANLVDGDNPDTIAVEGVEGEVTPFQALTSALSATVGLGNIAGVAIAIAIGGPGATFWMIIVGLLGMSSKFTECTLGVKYREIGPDGTVYGGPMYYLSKGLAEVGLGGLGKVFAGFFAVMCIGGSFGGGNMFQANQAAAQFLGTFGIDSGIAKTVFGLVVAALVAVVIIGGIKRIGKVAEKIVPTMAAIYVGAALFIIIANFGSIPKAFGLIFEGAFASNAVAGGIVGVLIQGFRRAAFSNEAGVGSAAIAHSAVKTSHAASEGIVALLEPFIDTVVICTMTALVIIITGNYINPEGLNGVDLTSAAFESTIPGFQYILMIAVVLFAFSTMLSWSYYGLQSWKYLFGKGKVTDLVYKVLFCVFVVIGSAMSLGSVTDFSDAMIFAMVFPNIIGLIILAPKVKGELKRYLDDIDSGKLKSNW
ncbi:MAG: alanine/glycine:cation symporter family protein [Bacteroidota bacterium]